MYDWRKNIFDRLYNFLTTYNKIPPNQFKNLALVPLTDQIMNLAGNNYLVATSGLLLLTDLYQDVTDLPVVLTTRETILLFKFIDAIRKHKWYDYINGFLKIFGFSNIINHPEEDFQEQRNNQINVGKTVIAAFDETDYTKESPAEKPRGVTLHYFEDLDPQSQRLANKVLKKHNNQFSSDVAREILHKTRVDINKLNEKWRKWQDLTPIEFYYESKNNPELIQILKQVDPQSHSILMKYIKMGEDAHKYYINLEHRDKIFADRMQCGVDEAPLEQKIEKCMVNDNPDFKTYINTDIQDEFQKRQNDLQLIADKDSTGTNWPAVLAGAGLLTLTGAGAYSAYRIWQIKKAQEKQLEQQQLEKQRMEIEYQRQLNNIRNKNRKHVYNNVINTNPIETLNV